MRRAAKVMVLLRVGRWNLRVKSTAQLFRELALAMPAAVEGAHQGHADFRCAGRVFASLHPDGEQAMVKVPPGEQQRLLRHGPAFVPASGAWGRAGCTMVRLADVERELLQDALLAAWQLAVATGAKGRAKK